MSLNTFEGVEDLKNYLSDYSLSNYRKEILKNFKPMAEFIKDIIPNKKLKVLEIGSGNSSLLYNLAFMDRLDCAIGIELAKSRHVFAEQWKKDSKIKNVNNINKDFRGVSTKGSSWDIFICNSTLQYFNHSLCNSLLKKASNSLSKGGYIVIDVPNYINNISKMVDGKYTFLRELPNTNPFKWAVYELSSNQTNNHGMYINTSKYFDNKGNMITSKEDIIYYWDEKTIRKLLSFHNFGSIKIYGSLTKEEYNSRIHEHMYIIAQK